MTSGSILVTGGAGFIGSNFLNLSVAQQPDRLFVNARQADVRRRTSRTCARSRSATTTSSSASTSPSASRSRTCCGGTSRALVVHFAAESHVDRSIVEPDAFIRTNIAGTFNLIEAFRRICAEPAGRAVPPRQHRRGLRLARRDRLLHRGLAVRPVEPVLGVEGVERPARARVRAHLRPADQDHQLLEQLRRRISSRRS